MSDKEYKKFIHKAWMKRPDVKEKINAYAQKYRDENREQVRATNKRFYEGHKEQRIQLVKANNVRPCKDPVLGDTVKYNTLIARMRHHPEFYEGIKPKDCLVHIPKIKGLDLLSEEQKEQLNAE